MEIPFPQGSKIILRRLPRYGVLYEPEAPGPGQLVQGEEIKITPFVLRSPQNMVYYRPFPKLVSLDAETPLSEFQYSLEQTSFDGSVQLQSQVFIVGFCVQNGMQADTSVLNFQQTCWVRLIVSAYPESTRPFSGAAGQALFFDGADDHVYAKITSFPSNALTVSMWIRTLGHRRAGQTVLSYLSTAGRELEIRDLNDVRVLRKRDETLGAHVSVNDGRWHQLGVTWQVDGRVRLYVDGRLVHKAVLPASSGMPPGGSLLLGQSGAVDYISARDLFREAARSSQTHGPATTSAEKTLLVNRIESLAQIRTSDGAWRTRSAAMTEGLPRGCACRGGVFDHARSFHGLMDEVR